MTKKAFAIYLSVYLSLISAAPTMAQNESSVSPATTPVGSRADVRESCEEPGDLVYPLINADYVGGTIPGVQMKRVSRRFPFGDSQYRVDGKLAAGSTCLFFIFKDKRLDEIARSPYHYELRPCPATPDSNSSASEVDQACRMFGKAGSALYTMEIPYKRMIVLSRARDTSLGATSASYASGAGGTLAILVATLPTAFSKALVAGLVGIGLATYFYLEIARPRLQDNYIAVFVAREGFSDKTANNNLFAKGDVLMFRLPNKHDFYNISMILSANTGQTFVSETAEKGQSETSK